MEFTHTQNGIDTRKYELAPHVHQPPAIGIQIIATAILHFKFMLFFWFFAFCFCC